MRRGESIVFVTWLSIVELAVVRLVDWNLRYMRELALFVPIFKVLNIISPSIESSLSVVAMIVLSEPSLFREDYVFVVELLGVRQQRRLRSELVY